MTKTAIDIVLLPSEEMTEKAIEMNRELLKNNDNKIVLHKEKCLPHISLCMGVITNEDLPVVKKALGTIAQQFSSFQLSAEGIEAVTIPTGKKFSMLKISQPDSLQALHEIVMKTLWEYLSYDIDTSMFYNPPEVEEISFGWIKSYAKKYADPSKYHPHLSLGVGETDKFTFPIDFTAPTLALCQLGNYCTCRKVLGKFDFAK